MARRPRARLSRRLRASVVSVSVALSACPSTQPKTVVYDLVARLPFAERWSSREVILFGTPSSEPNQASGFYREAGSAGGDRFIWGRKEAEVSFAIEGVAPRAAVVELAPYRGVKSQSVDVFLNGAAVAHFGLNDLRHRYGVALPLAAQHAGDNRLRFVFADEASPADADPKNADKRRLAAAFYTLTIGAASDAGIDDLLGREAARPFSVPDSGTPMLTQVGPSVVRYAIRLPDAAELRFTPDLDPAARAAAGAASFRVTIEAMPGDEREIWSRVISARDPKGGEAVVGLPGHAGEIVRLALHVGAAPRDRFAWGTWQAPRILGRGDALADPGAPSAAAETARGASLSRALANSNVLFMILDAGRAWEFGCYGYGRATTPEIDRIATEGVVFENAFTPAVYTLGAMSSVWTSQYPDRHHSEVSFSARLPKDRLTLAEVLGANGIATGGFVANAVAGTLFGFDRGFGDFREIFRDLGSGADGFRKVVPPWIHAHKDRRFFAYVHFREPHFPYNPPPPFDTKFGPEGPIAKGMRQQSDWIGDLNQARRKPRDGEIDHLVRLYDGNVAFADQEIGALRKTLESEGLWESTVVIVAADHGEGLFEHAFIGHNVHVYEEAMRIPLVIRLPKGTGPSGVRIKGLADLLDIAPTIADVFGVLGKGGSAKEFQGRSLLPVLDGGPGKSAVLSRTVWDRPRYALRDERFKFIYDTRTGEGELYDLAADAAETRNIASQEVIRSAYYRQALHQWVASLARTAGGAGEEAKLTREQCENLRSLGYITGDCK
ncbi:MAG: sulfatase [Vicinamibacteria bacterium]